MDARGGVQVRMDHLLVTLGNPVRIGIMKFLERARKNDEPIQSFGTIGRALKNLNQEVSTANLGYHLAALKKVMFIMQPEGPTNGYMLTDLGRKMVDILGRIEDIALDSHFLRPNVLDEYTYMEHVDMLLESINQENHFTSVEFVPRTSLTPIDGLVSSMDSLKIQSREKTPKKNSKKHEFSRLDGFIEFSGQRR